MGKPGKKGVRGRMPTKRSINLILIDEKKISIGKAVPAVLAILVLAALFSKFLVADRLVTMTQSSSRVSQMRADLDQAMVAVQQFGDVESTYAHYTLNGMSPEELSLVQRTQVLELVSTFLPVRTTTLTLAELRARLMEALRSARTAPDALEAARLIRARLTEQVVTDNPPIVTAQSWSVSGNMLTVEVAGPSLETMNVLARRMEQDPIVDSATISTANKATTNVVAGEEVKAKLFVYLQQPPEEPEGEEAAAQ